ncbi:hypothetical protein Hypma_009728 [Hypsizygus marmoreus]|uniref:DUF6533 domain-containing protein n=1 Tax=Hypsizygus marmoreus TaxID=39966 RepID=A0A369JLD4_HYPMA|nr:hypothetical protein Hypma_009728 [Hypsizygus marmoreus]
MNAVTIDPETAVLLKLVADARITNYVAVASLTWLLYDHVITFRDEVELVWKGSRWKSFLKIFYIWNRYFCAVAISLLTAQIRSDSVYANTPPVCYSLRRTDHLDSCRVFYWLEGVLCITIIAMVDSVLVLRVWILYNRDRRLLCFLIPLITIEVTVMLLVDLLVVPRAQGYIHVGPSLTGCYPLSVPKYLVFYAVPSLIVAFIMFSMTLFKCLFSLRAGLANRMPIVSLFLRDGVFWFLGVFVSIGATVLNWTIGKPTLIELTNTPSVVIFSLIASHALLNIKGIMSSDVVDGTVVNQYQSGNFNPRSVIFRPLAHLNSSRRDSDVESETDPHPARCYP